jgi:IS1 family transposase
LIRSDVERLDIESIGRPKLLSAREAYFVPFNRTANLPGSYMPRVLEAKFNDSFDLNSKVKVYASSHRPFQLLSHQRDLVASSLCGNSCVPSGPTHLVQLPAVDSRNCDQNSKRNRSYPKRSGLIVPVLFCVLCIFVNFYALDNSHRWGYALLSLCSLCCFGYCFCLALNSVFEILDSRQKAPCEHGESWQGVLHGNTVTQKYFLTSDNYCNTVMCIGRTRMANVLSTEKQVAVIGALAEGSSIRSIERITGVHRDTIMRLGVRVGQGCQSLLDQKMRGPSTTHLEFDEIWGFIGKKEKHVRPEDNPTLGDVWTFCAIDADTKLVPAFKVGKRDSETANAFVSDVAGRLKNRVQISSDALHAYVGAVEQAFGADVDFAQIVKTYAYDVSEERNYSAPEIVITEKRSITGHPNMRRASTSYIERLNGTTRLHMRRLTRLTYAFSKKRENFEAAVGLHFAYYNFVKRHSTLRCTPAMAAGVERDFWTVGDLVEAAA